MSAIIELCRWLRAAVEAVEKKVEETGHRVTASARVVETMDREFGHRVDALRRELHDIEQKLSRQGDDQARVFRSDMAEAKERLSREVGASQRDSVAIQRLRERMDVAENNLLNVTSRVEAVEAEHRPARIEAAK